MSPRRITLSERMAAVERAHSVFTGAERAPTRPSEREYLSDCLRGAYEALRMLAANEADLLAFIECRRAARERGAIEGAPAAAAAPNTAKPARRARLGMLAALRCRNVLFQRFLGAGDEAAASAAVRTRCAVESRGEFDRDAKAAERWRALEAEFITWRDCAGGAAERAGSEGSI
ncbi:hypothetical protein [Methylosinus sp. LW4]|uniref:hypothetical protein n=1 Tax=Methylosinus sp. LW4 TaxID=136993 RepID=UPI0003703B25|nr:hypothetical protein [Methylosinus sp. LW4]